MSLLAQLQYCVRIHIKKVSPLESINRVPSYWPVINFLWVKETLARDISSISSLPFLTHLPSHRPPSTGIQLSQSFLSLCPWGNGWLFSRVCYCLESQAWPCRQQSHQSLRGQETAFQQPGQSEAHGLQLPHGAGQRQLWEGERATSEPGGASVEDVGPVGPSLPEDSGAAL